MLFLFFIVPPIVSLPFLFFAIYHKKKIALTLFALWLGIFAMLLPPGGDAYQHNILYFDLLNGVEEFHIRYDCLFQSLLYLFTKLSIPFGCFRCLCVFTTYFICFSLFQNASNKNPSLQESPPRQMLAFVLFFFSISLIQTISGMRFMLAASMLTVGVYIWLEEKNLHKSFFFILLACCTHFSVWVFAVLMLIIYLPHFKLPKPVLIVLLVIGLSTSVLSDYILEGLTFFDTQTEDYLQPYVSGKWAEDFLTEASLEYQIYRWLTIIAVFSAVFILCVFFHPKKKMAKLSFAVCSSD